LRHVDALFVVPFLLPVELFRVVEPFLVDADDVAFEPDFAVDFLAGAFLVVAGLAAQESESMDNIIAKPKIRIESSVYHSRRTRFRGRRPRL
jgi:hypothetical protein